MLHTLGTILCLRILPLQKMNQLVESAITLCRKCFCLVVSLQKKKMIESHNLIWCIEDYTFGACVVSYLLLGLQFVSISSKIDRNGLILRLLFQLDQVLNAMLDIIV